MRVLTARQVNRILERQGFVQVRQRGSHRRYRGVVGGRTRHVSVAQHRNIPPNTLSAIIRQSGLPKDLFE
ncbi:MAG: addiction module toxin, HicA family [Chloroflexi bacterium]|nr:addiction module toxin, HicA family [Chloroflexota bacterium]MYF22613.1 addiction module toxin, HicA family [Chloroflexota bacterium]